MPSITFKCSVRLLLRIAIGWTGAPVGQDCILQADFIGPWTFYIFSSRGGACEPLISDFEVKILDQLGVLDHFGA